MLGQAKATYESDINSGKANLAKAAAAWVAKATQDVHKDVAKLVRDQAATADQAKILKKPPVFQPKK